MGESSLAAGFKTGFGSAFLQSAFERLADLGSIIWREIGVIWRVEEEHQKLFRIFHRIQNLVDHMESSPLRFSGGRDGRSKAWQVWFEDLRNLSYDAESLLDYVSLKLSMHHSSNQENRVRPMVLSSFRELNLPYKIKEMHQKLEELAKEMEGLVMIEKLKQDSCNFASTRSQFPNFNISSSYVDGESIVGRALDKEHILGLLKQSDSRDLSVISLVGMAGVGKTTLARHVYDDEFAMANFEKRIWVCVSIDFDVLKITKSIIEFATLCPCNLTDLNALQAKLQSILCGTKFLLVLDNYSNERHGDWDILSSPFRFGSKGSKIIVTMQSTKVLSIFSSCETYKLDVLSDDDCWNLINQRACTMNPSLELIGKQIANKCKGLPLAAVSLGRVLRHKSNEDEWRSILDCELWDISENDNVFPSLMLSYLHLPNHLKRCFSYCSIFPKGYKFEVDELIMLWMAQGFIQPLGTRRLEELGNDYFNGLHSRSFFQQFSTSSKKIFKMHDLIHDMARLVAKDVCCHVKYSTLDCYPLFGKACHLSLLHDNTQPLKLNGTMQNERLRTFLVMCSNPTNPTSGEVDLKLFLKLRCLKVLGLSGVGLKELPDCIDHLIYIRYLNLSWNPITHLPESVCKLVALQTLKLINCSELRELPKDINCLCSLRHLELEVTGKLQSMPPQFGSLVNLQTLSMYLVGMRKGNGISELKNMDNLRGSLCIKNLDWVSSAGEANEAKLAVKKCLEKLELHWRKLGNLLYLQLPSQRRNEEVRIFESLQPHKTLKELVVENYCGITCPSWLSQSSRQFISIHLHGLKFCEVLPSLGQLPLLKFFYISDMSSLQQIGDSFYGSGNAEEFPSLEFFQLHNMQNLRNWTSANTSAMPRLTSFTIHDCPQLASLPRRLQFLMPNSNISNCPRL